uniref:Cytosolic fatty-acid binding proteins domain-containing protein n=1 Tax=Aotus nancymaae TaxID=37293 RepID=A0A2K5BVA4_AOTNA
ITFDGNWKVDRRKNYEKFMEKVGANTVKRKLAAHDNLNTFRNIEVVFELGGTWTVLEGNEIGKFIRTDNGNDLDAVTDTYVYEGVEAKRIFKKD